MPRAAGAGALTALLLLLTFAIGAKRNDRVIFAVNSGGERFVSKTNVEYQPDTDGQPVVIGPDTVSARVQFEVARAAEDTPLFTTERYATRSFEYRIPVPDPGQYVLVLRFAEVYFQASNRKVFDVALNEQIVVEALDIFHKAGFATAHDEYVEFEITEGRQLVVQGSSQAVSIGQELSIQFLKGEFDNPKVCAFAVIKGKTADARPLFPLQSLPAPSGTEDLGWRPIPPRKSVYLGDLPYLSVLAAIVAVLIGHRVWTLFFTRREVET